MDLKELAVASLDTLVLTWLSTLPDITPGRYEKHDHYLVALPLPEEFLSLTEELASNQQQAEHLRTAFILQFFVQGLVGEIRKLFEKHGSIGGIKKDILGRLMEEMR